MITTNVIQRTFRLKSGDRAGSCFTIDVENKQYVITARHVVCDLRVGAVASVEVLHQDVWKRLGVQVAWLSDVVTDVAILSPEIQLSPSHGLEHTTAHATIGQQVYFCGFTDLVPQVSAKINNGFPFAVVRQGILAGMSFEDGEATLLIDGHNVPGFSGGPVVFQPPGQRDFRVAGVVSGYRFERKPVMCDGKDTGLYIEDNSGLVVAHAFKQGVEHVRANPSGAEIGTS